MKYAYRSPAAAVFAEYRQKVRERNANGERPQPHGHDDRNPKKLGERDRGFWELIASILATCWQAIDVKSSSPW